MHVTHMKMSHVTASTVVQLSFFPQYNQGFFFLASNFLCGVYKNKCTEKMLSLESISERGTMKKALVFLLTLALSLSGTNTNKLVATINQIFTDLHKLQHGANPPINFVSK